MLSIR